MQSLVKMIIMVALLLFVSPLLEGVLRKFKALVHSRIGPPLLQPYWDILKLLGKDDVRSPHSFLGPLPAFLGLAAILAAGLLVPLGNSAPFASGDLFLFLYLISFASVCVMLAGMDSGSPYGFLGTAREMMTSFVVEPVLFIALITVAIKTHNFRFSDMAAWQQISGTSLSTIISGLALFLGIQAQLSKLPFDIPEAEGELMGGTFAEMSGPTFALYRWGFIAKQVIFSMILAQLFFPWPLGLVGLWAMVAQIVKVVLIVVLVGLIDVVNPRLRIDQALIYYFGVIMMAIVGLVFALVGA
ncbi:MAG: NADH-quinone oxidoreductase subunit H [bacterium]|nr:NADH-quinone oxidoreductase subunit H [bacterium]